MADSNTTAMDNTTVDSDEEVQMSQQDVSAEKEALLASPITVKLVLEEKEAKDDYKDKYGSKLPCAWYFTV